MASTRPSPANVLLSKTLKLPPSSVSELALFTHSARNGRATPSDSLHSETFSAAISVWRIGTRADWFFRIVTRSLSLYSKRSPNAFPSATRLALLPRFLDFRFIHTRWWRGLRRWHRAEASSSCPPSASTPNPADNAAQYCTHGPTRDPTRHTTCNPTG